MTTEQLARLKTEIQVDPVGMAYGTWVTLADDQRIQGLLVDPSKRPKPGAVLVESWRVFNTFDATEFGSRSTAQLTALMVMLAAGSVDLSSTAVRSILSTVFPANGNTRAALVALWTSLVANTTQSRAQELGIGVTIEDVTAARS